jgi:peptidoglycan/LPS O-acetylase OafA/YrhL
MREHREIRALTGIRGIAACMVVVYHYLQDVSLPHLVRNLVLHGYVAVDLFFVLSGFVMSLTYSDAFAYGFRMQTFLNFLGRRLGRVYPLYLFALVIEIIILGFQASLPGPEEVTSNALMIQTWVMQNSIVIPAWSISVEFTVYLLFPLLVVGVLRKQIALTWVAAFLAMVLLAYTATRSAADLHELMRHGPLDVWGETPFTLLRCLAGFTLGMVAFRLAQLSRVRLLFKSGVLSDVLLAVLIVLLFIPDSDLVLALLFVPIVIGLATTNRSLASAVLSSRVVYWLGVISYSVYMIHPLVEGSLVEPLQNFFAKCHLQHGFSLARILLFALVLGLSALSYALIEKPGRTWIRRILRERRSSIIPDAPAP